MSKSLKRQDTEVTKVPSDGAMQMEGGSERSAGKSHGPESSQSHKTQSGHERTSNKALQKSTKSGEAVPGRMGAYHLFVVMLGAAAYFLAGKHFGYAAVHAVLSNSAHHGLSAASALLGHSGQTLSTLLGSASRFLDSAQSQPFSPRACEALRQALPAEVQGQSDAVATIVSATCAHLASTDPQGPLVFSLHGPPGVGKSLTHRVLALSLWDVPPERRGSCQGPACPGYLTLFGVNYYARDREEQWAKIREEMVRHLKKHKDALVVIEEYDRLDCKARGFLRQLMDHGVLHAEGVDARRAVMVLESNAGMAEVVDEARKAYASGGGAVSTPQLQASLKNTLYEQWSRDEACEDEASSSLTNSRAISLVDFYVPFFPLHRSHIREVTGTFLARTYAPVLRSKSGYELQWDDDVVDFLADHIEYTSADESDSGPSLALEGAVGVRNVVNRMAGQALEKEIGWGDGARGTAEHRVVRLAVREGRLVAVVKSA